MNKLKIMKILVFLLTFLMVFMLCLLVNRVVVKKDIQNFEIHLQGAKKIDNFSVEGDYGYVVTSDTVYVVNIKKGKYKGFITTREEK